MKTQKEPLTEVIYKRDGKDVIACFPALAGTCEPHTCVIYATMGQHSSGSINYLSGLKPAKPNQYADLQRELEVIGYRLKVVKKFLPRHLEERKKQIAL